MADVTGQSVAGTAASTPSTSPSSPRTQLRSLMEEIDPRYMLSPEVEEFCVLFAEDFIDKVAALSSRLAALRRSSVMERKDVAFCLEKNFGLKVFPSQKQLKAINSRTLSTGSACSARHESNLAAVRAAKHRSQQQQKHNKSVNQTAGSTLSDKELDGSVAKKKKKSVKKSKTPKKQVSVK